MSTEENKAIVRRMTEEFYNQGNVDLADHFFADTYVHHDPASPQMRNRDGLKEGLRAFLAGCPDLHITSDQLLAEGDMVTKRWTYHATQSGDLSGLPPTGKRITMSGLELFRLEGGTIVECWLAYDNLSLMQQLGIIPTPSRLASKPCSHLSGTQAVSSGAASCLASSASRTPDVSWCAGAGTTKAPPRRILSLTFARPAGLASRNDELRHRTAPDARVGCGIEVDARHTVAPAV